MLRIDVVKRATPVTHKPAQRLCIIGTEHIIRVCELDMTDRIVHVSKLAFT